MNNDEAGEPIPFKLRVRRGVKRGQPIRVVEIRYTPCPDADGRLQKALAVLLRGDRDETEVVDTKDIQDTMS